MQRLLTAYVVKLAYFKAKVAWCSVMVWLPFCTKAAMMSEAVSSVEAHALGTESRRDKMTRRAATVSVSDDNSGTLRYPYHASSEHLIRDIGHSKTGQEQP